MPPITTENNFENNFESKLSEISLIVKTDCDGLEEWLHWQEWESIPVLELAKFWDELGTL